MILSISPVPTEAIVVDAAAYQFKSGGDDHGVTDRLLAVRAWDPLAAHASPILLHRRLDGTLCVVDGHQRVGLARRLGVPMLWSVQLDEHTVSVADARRAGARLNLQQGTGSAIDVAKLLRDQPLTDPERAAMPTDTVSGETLRIGEALATLGPTAFLRVVDGKVHPVPRKNAAYAAVVARLVDGDAEQDAALVAMARATPESSYQADQFVRVIVADGFARGVQTGLFGAETVATSLAAPMAQILTAARRVLLTDRAALGNVLRHEGRLLENGNQLNQAANRAGVADAHALEAALGAYSHTAGAVRTALKAIAGELSAGRRTLGSAVDGFLQALGEAIGHTPPPTARTLRSRLTTWRYRWHGVDDVIEATSEAKARAAIRVKHKLSWVPNGATVVREDGANVV